MVFFCARYYFGGQYLNTDYLAYNLDVSGTELSIAVNTTSQQGIQKIEINESEGVVEISVRGVEKSLFYKTSADSEFVASENIRQVWIGDRIVWADGEMISPLASGLYAVYNPYIGNMPANGKIVNTLNMTAYTGGFTNELQTSKEPYSWKMIFNNDFSFDRQEAFEDRLHKYAYIFLAQIGNLNEVIYEYKVEGETRILSVTSSEASEFAGEDIKTVGTDIFLLEELVKKTELSNVVIGGAAVDSNAQVDFSNSGQTEKVLGFTVVNYAEDDICEVYLSVEAGKTSAHQSMSRADGASLLSGENVDFQLIPEDFAKEIKDGSKATIKLSVKDPKGNSHKVQGASCIIQI